MRASVALASFNGEKYIKEQLESILQQTMLPYEIVISDDGSTDKTLLIVKEIINKYAHIPVRFIVLRNNYDHGVRSNFENALCNTTGDLVFLCDQDDIWLPNKIKIMTTIMSEREENAAFHNARLLIQQEDESFSIGNQTLLDLMNKGDTSERVVKLHRKDVIWDAFHHHIIQGMCVCIKQPYLRSVLPLSKGTNHDNWLEFCAAADDTLIYTPEELALYRVHENNTCGIVGKFKKKRNIIEKIRTFDNKGKNSIMNQYIWYQDAKAYLGEIDNAKAKKLFAFFGCDRIKILSGSKIRALINLENARKKGCYNTEGNIVYYHDIWFVLRYRKKYRRNFIKRASYKIRRKE